MLMPKDMTSFLFVRPMVEDTEDYAKPQETDNMEEQNQ